MDERDQDCGGTLLEVTDLRTHIKMRDCTVHAVDGVSLTVKAGETVGLVGESGCGKSMTGLSIMRLLPPGGQIAGGRIRLSGRELTTLPEAEMRRIRGNEVGMVFQDPMTALNPTMTVGGQIAEAVRAHRRTSREEALDRAVEVLDLVGMPKPRERLRSYAHQLSGGLRQRVVLAMALACEPKLLIADEPTTALDLTIQSQILNLLDALKDRMKMGMLLVTHDLGVIAGRADRTIVMYAGRIVESGHTDAVLANMRHPYTEALLQAIPPLDSDQRRVLYSIPGLPPDLAQPPRCCRFAQRCRYARDRCRDEEPALVAEGPHSYACFFPVDGPGGADRAGTVAREHEERTQRRHADMKGADAKTVAAAPDLRAASAQTAAGCERVRLVVMEHAVKEYPLTKGLLQREFGSVKAVSDVSLVVYRGETFGLVGESGCGKTTLARLIVGQEKVDSGSVVFDGEDLAALRGSALRRYRKQVQLIFQDPYASLDPRMKVMTTLREPLVAQKIGTRHEQEKRVRELLAEVGLAARAVSLYPHEFSGGQRQRIGFARALTLEPRLIVADEPVSALDVSIQAQVLNLMKRLRAQRDLTFVVISHDLSVIRYLADRIGVMYLGKLVEVGEGDDIYERPAHPYTAGLLASIPVPDPARERGRDEITIAGELPSAATPPSGCRFRTRCPRAQDICAEREPVLRPFHRPSHQAACHFPLEEPLDAGGSVGSESARSGSGAAGPSA